MVRLIVAFDKQMYLEVTYSLYRFFVQYPQCFDDETQLKEVEDLHDELIDFYPENLSFDIGDESIVEKQK